MMNVLNPFSFPQTFKDELSNNQNTFTHNYIDNNNVKNNGNSESKNSGLRCEPKTQLTSPNQPTERILLTFNSKAFSVFRPMDGIPCILQDQYTSDLSIQLFMKALQNYFKLNNDVILYFPNINLKFRNYTHSIKTSLTQIIQFHKTDNVVLEIEEEASCFETLYSSIIDELFTEPHYEQNPENDEQNTASVEMNDDNDNYNDNASFAVFVSPKQSVHESENGSLANDPLHFDDYQFEFSEFIDISCDQSPSVSSAHHLHHQSEFSNLGKREFGLCCASNDEDNLSSLKKQKFL